jgi:hypothetical protein
MLRYIVKFYSIQEAPRAPGSPRRRADCTQVEMDEKWSIEVKVYRTVTNAFND